MNKGLSFHPHNLHPSIEAHTQERRCMVIEEFIPEEKKMERSSNFSTINSISEKIRSDLIVSEMTLTTPMDLSESERFSGRKPAKTLEKSNFSQTCSLLSKYLKQKGSFRDMSLGMTCNLDGKGKTETIRPTTAMDLLPKMGISGEASDKKEGVSDRKVKSMDLFPQHAGFGPSEESLKESNLSRPPVEPKTAPMTILYGGRALVFNDFPAEKVREIMRLAGEGSAQSQGNGFAPKNPNLSSASDNNSHPNNIRQPTQAAVSGDLPIARKVSLHRFLEKRKERISSKAPYTVHRKDSAAAPSKPAMPMVESKSWLGLSSLQSN